MKARKKIETTQSGTTKAKAYRFWHHPRSNWETSRALKTNSRFDVPGRIALVLLVSAVGTALAVTNLETTTPIKHLVVIFQENHSFDAYFATYPVAANPP